MILDTFCEELISEYLKAFGMTYVSCICIGLIDVQIFPVQSVSFNKYGKDVRFRLSGRFSSGAHFSSRTSTNGFVYFGFDVEESFELSVRDQCGEERRNCRRREIGP